MALTAARYGKDLIRVFRVVRNEGGKDGVHDVAEYNVRALVEGDIATSFTQGDNSVVVATDSIKNMVYYLAKTSPHVLSPELFGAHIGIFILSRYPHLKKAFVDLEKLKWSRIVVGSYAIGKDAGPSVLKANDGGHRHSFQRDGEEKRIAKLEITKGQGNFEVKIVSGLSDLLLLKSSGSAFTKFVRDEFTTLVETISDVDEILELEKALQFETAAKISREIVLDLFATHDSASVQATLFKMGEKLIAEHPHLDSVSYVLPNKHYIPVDMKYLGIENMKEDSAEVFMPVSAPSGRITATVSRQ